MPEMRDTIIEGGMLTGARRDDANNPLLGLIVSNLDEAINSIQGITFQEKLNTLKELILNNKSK